MESTNVPMSKRLIGIALAAVFIVGIDFHSRKRDALVTQGVIDAWLAFGAGVLVGYICATFGRYGTFHHCNVSGFGHRRRLGPGNWRFC